MGFSGGGSNVLKNHQHDATVVQDGGALDADNVTSASLTQGDVIYSDGAHLQRLPIGNASDKLEVNPGATAPQWAAGAAGGTWTSIYDDYDFAGSLDTGHQASWGDYRYLDIYLSGQTTVNNQIQMRIYDPDGNEYTPTQYFTYGRRLAPGPDDDVFGNGAASPPSFGATGQLDLSGGFAQYAEVQWGLFMKLQMLSPNSWAFENLVTGYYSLMAKETMIQGTFAIGRSGVTSTDNQLVQGLKLISPSTGQTGSFCQVFGAGNSSA